MKNKISFSGIFLALCLISKAQNVGVGTTAPLMNLHVVSTDSAVILSENTQLLNTGVSNAFYFKTGSGSFPYTGAIKTIGEGTSTARLSLFTYASTTANQLLERFSITDAGNVGIGITTPLAKLHVANSNILFTSPALLPASPGLPPVSGPGNRMFWYADKAALRAGGVTANLWDQANIGQYSCAFGLDAKASGTNSAAIGQYSTAGASDAIALGFLSSATGISSVAINGKSEGYDALSLGGWAVGDYSVSIGSGGTATGTNAVNIMYNSTASGPYSIAMGESATASGTHSLAAGFTTSASGTSSTALGYLTHATGFVSTALGLNTTASGDYSTTMGRITTASGDYSTASGYNNVASGDYSTALGRDVSTNNFAGCLAIGDASGLGVTNCVRVNELRARFAGGYALYTSGVGISGVFMLNGANAWSSISDSTKKENFLPVDGGYVINCIEKMKLGSWNYKQQDKKIFRHYGPMAQEFYSAFGNDGIGKIGCDTLINSADIDGVMMIGLQALAKRSNSLEAENKILRENNIVFQEEINRIKNVNAKMNQATEDKIALLEKQVSMLIAASENKITGATITVK